MTRAPWITFVALTLGMTATAAPDCSKRAQNLDGSIKAELVGKWTNPVDKVVIEIPDINLTTGELGTGSKMGTVDCRGNNQRWLPTS